MMDDLVQWLRAQLDEDEQIIRGARGEYEHFYEDGHSKGVMRFLERWNPVGLTSETDMVVRELEAKRRILDMRGEWAVYSEPYTALPAWERTVRLIAAIYADRPGYHEEWMQ